MLILESMKHVFKQFLGLAAGGVLLAASVSVWADRLPLAELAGAKPASSAQPAPSASVPDTGPDFYAGVKAYREGNYKQAERIFSVLHKQAPENAQYTYYLAIANAQLGRFQQAKRYYEEIITLEPHGKAASLAKKGLDYLPKENELDLPPRFATEAAESRTSAHQATQPEPTTAQAAQQPNAAMADVAKQAMQQGMQGMSPQDWMALQMMMGQNGMYGGNGGGGMNPMMWMMPGMMGGNANGGGSYDPNAMSNMMMNQMMQGFGGMGGGESSGGYP